MRIIELCPGCGTQIERFKNPYPTTDVIVNVGGKIVLINRKNAPHGWAIPGGFIDYGESAEHAAVREIREETGLEINNLCLFGVYSDPKRDPRFHTLTVVFTADSTDVPHAGDDAADAALFGADELPGKLAFDHADILRDYFRSRNG